MKKKTSINLAYKTKKRMTHQENLVRSFSPIPIFLTLLLVVTSCATGRYIDNPAPLGDDLGLNVTDELVQLSLKHVVVSNGPGSWVEDAGWDEYVFEVRNLSDQAITIEQIQLIDPRGIYLENDLQPEQLESLSQRMLEEYQDAGIAVAIGAVPYVAVTAGAAAGSLGAVAGAVALAPVAVIAAPLWYFQKKQTDQVDKENIESEFRRRRISTVTMTGNATMEGSGFFPIVPSPQALVATYRQGSNTETLQLPLNQLRVNVPSE